MTTELGKAQFSAAITEDPEELFCRVCGRTEVEHVPLQHEFSRNGGLHPKNRTGDDDASHDPASQGSIGIALKGDPVLRIALIRAGVLTPEMLSEIENELRSAGIASAAPQTVV